MQALRKRLQQWPRSPYFFTMCSSLLSSMNGFPTATTSDLARVMAVMKTAGSEMLFVESRVSPSGLVGSEVLINSALNSWPIENLHLLTENPCYNVHYLVSSMWATFGHLSLVVANPYLCCKQQWPEIMKVTFWLKNDNSVNLPSARRKEAHFSFISFPPVIGWPMPKEVGSFTKSSINFNFANAVFGLLDMMVKAGTHKSQWERGIWMSCVVSNFTRQW